MNIDIHDRNYRVQVEDYKDDPIFAVLSIKFGAEDYMENVIKMFCDGTNHIRFIAQSIIDACDKVQDEVKISEEAKELTLNGGQPS
jgi:hypothetical protein